MTRLPRQQEEGRQAQRDPSARQIRSSWRSLPAAQIQYVVLNGRGKLSAVVAEADDALSRPSASLREEHRVEIGPSHGAKSRVSYAQADARVQIVNLFKDVAYDILWETKERRCGLRIGFGAGNCKFAR